MRNLVRQEIRRRDDEPIDRIFELVRSRFYTRYSPEPSYTGN